MNIKRTTQISILLFPLFSALIFASAASAIEVKRTCLIVENISCNSCLASIEERLKRLDGTIGMKGDSRLGLLLIDHRPDLDGESIAAIVTSIGYPAKVDWNATIAKQNAFAFAPNNRFAAGCDGGCSSLSGRGEAGPRLWNPEAANAEDVMRTFLRVSNLSCSSCLLIIEAQLRDLAGTIGMTGDLEKGLVDVSHEPSLTGQKIADVITGLGYPAKIISTTDKATYQIVFSGQKNNSTPPDLRGPNCNRRICNVTVTAWKKLYKRYITK